MATEGQKYKDQYHMEVNGQEQNPGEVHQMVKADEADEIKEREAKLKKDAKNQ